MSPTNCTRSPILKRGTARTPIIFNDTASCTMPRECESIPIVEILRSRIGMGLGDGHFPDFGIDGFPDRSQPWMVRAVGKFHAFGDDYFATAAQVFVYSEPVISFAIFWHTASSLSLVLYASILCTALLHNAFSSHFVGLIVATRCHLKLQ